MKAWAELGSEAPEIAAAARRMLWVPGFGLGYLATIRADGGPRIHPINLAIVDGRLVAFIGPSPKLDDLRRDGRFALHAPGSETENDEVAITGRAVERNADTDLRAAAVAAMAWTVPDDNVLFELGLTTVLWVEYASPPAFPPTYHRWRANG